MSNAQLCSDKPPAAPFPRNARVRIQELTGRVLEVDGTLRLVRLDDGQKVRLAVCMLADEDAP